MFIFTKEYLTLILLWSAWCVIHSAMISITLTNYLKSRLGKKFRFYRLFYNAIALLTLMIVLLYAYSIPSETFFLWQGYLRIFQLFLLVVAAYFFIAGMKHYDMLQLLGIRQIKDNVSHVSLSESGKLETSGVLGITRHPWYLATIFLIWARQIDFQSLITNVILTAYLIIGTFLEERRLLLEFGETYREYQKKVSMLVPFKWIKSKYNR